jgi:hypothetical protein
MGPKTMNNYAGEDQQHFTGLNNVHPDKFSLTKAHSLCLVTPLQTAQSLDVLDLGNQQRSPPN